MATIVQIRRGNTAGIMAYTGPVGEIVFNTSTGRLHVQDGITQGGIICALVSDSGGGDGDMQKSVYDPNNIGLDVFSQGNMRETTTAKVMTGSEREKLLGIDIGATANSSDEYLVALANATGTLAQSKVEGLANSLSLLQPKADKNKPNGYAGLDQNGLISKAHLPALAITDTFIVATEAAMLALDEAEKGDIAIRTDVNKTFILREDPYNVLANWSELVTPTAGVTSIGTLTGPITFSELLNGLNLDQVDNTRDMDKPISTATQEALDEKWGPATLKIDYGSL